MFSDRKVYDITRSLENGITVWPGDDGAKIERVATIGKDSLANVSRINMGVHTGTHMDAPLHFVAGGNDIAGLSLDKLMGEVLVIETPDSIIDETVLEGAALNGVDAVFFKTTSSRRSLRDPFFEPYPAITEGCAKALVEQGIKTVGTDYFSIELYSDKQFRVHKTLLSNDVAIVENLALEDIEPGLYSFISLPLKIAGSDGSPCRVLLFK